MRELHRVHRCQLIIPEFALLEVLNAILFSPRVQEPDLATALQTLRDIELQIEPLEWGFLGRAIGIGWTYRLALYDAVYVALAETLGLPFVTADDALSRKMRGHGHVVRLRELQLN